MGDKGPIPTGRPLPSSFDSNDEFYNENGLQKITRKLKQEPLIPLGCLLTVAAFANAYRAMRRGDHAQVQRMFRARVAAQGFTVLAMVAGGIYYGNERHKERELWKLQQQQDDEEKRQRWIKELEARDQEDKALKERLERRKKKNSGATADQDGNDGDGDKDKGTTSILPSLGGWFGGAKKPADAPGPQTKGEGHRAALAAAAAAAATEKEERTNPEKK